jgi:uncharacterized membrane protein YkoI
MVRSRRYGQLQWMKRIGQPNKTKLDRTAMKRIHLLLIAGLLAVGLSACVSEQAKLMSQAKVSKADAEKTALAKVPGGKMQDGELENEGGKLIWSFDISTPGTEDITEVAVDAVSGEVVSVDTETPADQAKEKAADAKEKKQKKDED